MRDPDGGEYALKPGWVLEPAVKPLALTVRFTPTDTS